MENRYFIDIAGDWFTCISTLEKNESGKFEFWWEDDLDSGNIDGTIEYENLEGNVVEISRKEYELIRMTVDIEELVDYQHEVKRMIVNKKKLKPSVTYDYSFLINKNRKKDDSFFQLDNGILLERGCKYIVKTDEPVKKTVWQGFQNEGDYVDTFQSSFYRVLRTCFGTTLEFRNLENEKNIHYSIEPKRIQSVLKLV